eukprot:11804419-Alexandrium_andersonii.AAC.1
MSASLVGSEMCIRDRRYICCCTAGAGRQECIRSPRTRAGAESAFLAVSYTHLTLPTICSV